MGQEQATTGDKSRLGRATKGKEQSKMVNIGTRSTPRPVQDIQREQ